MRRPAAFVDASHVAYSDHATRGVLDMVFNLGSSGVVQKSATFTRAARRQDWATCAAECRRRGIQKSRNEKTRALLEEIASTA